MLNVALVCVLFCQTCKVCNIRAKVCYMAKYDDITYNEAEFHWNHKLNWQYAGEMHYLLYSDMAGYLKLIALTINTL